MLKKINPEHLKEGQEYYVKLKFYRSINKGGFPLHFRDAKDCGTSLPLNQPIFTIEEQPHHPDPELAILVNAASRLYSTNITFSKEEYENAGINIKDKDQMFIGYKRMIAREAADLIAACKRIKEEIR